MISTRLQQWDEQFWAGDKEAKERILGEVLAFANADPEAFRNAWAEIPLGPLNSPWSMVMEALSKDAGQWEEFFVDQLYRVLEEAEEMTNPLPVLECLSNFAHVETQQHPFIQRLADRLVKGLDSQQWAVRAACVTMLTYYMDNPAVKDTEHIIPLMQRRLLDPALSVRYLAMNALRAENLLPVGFVQPLKDRFMLALKGKPNTIC